MKTKAKWTFMVYMAGDNNLSAAGDKDIREMRSVGSTNDVNILAEFDNEGNRGTNRYLIRNAGENIPEVALGETDSGDPQVLINFVDWAVDNYPAERYMLILWNHGGGWEPSEMDRIARSVDASSYNIREASERSASPVGRLFFRSSLKKIFKLGSSTERAICSDDGSGHSLDTIELGNVLAYIHDKLGKPLDILGMDACLMSNLEVAYQAENFVKYIVASEESEPNDGWPYNRILKKLVEVPDLPASELVTYFVHAYINSYKERNYNGAVTQTALNLSKIQLLTEPLNRLAESLIDAMPDISRAIWYAQKRSVRFWHNTLWDLSHFCKELEKETVSQEVYNALKQVQNSLNQGTDCFVLSESHAGSGVENCGGVSIYLIPPLYNISQYYQDLDFAKDSNWLNMLRAYHAS